MKMRGSYLRPRESGGQSGRMLRRGGCHLQYPLVLSRAALLNCAHRPDADRAEYRTGGVVHDIVHVEGAVGEPRQTPVTGQLAQLDEGRQREAAQGRGAVKKPSGMNIATLKKSCAYTVVAKRRRPMPSVRFQACCQLQPT